MALPPSLFITGTDTDAGKTVLTRALARALRSLDINVRAIKPVESGCQTDTGESNARDAALIAEAAGHQTDCLFRFAAPLAPADAAKLEPTTPAFSIDAVLSHARKAQEHHTHVLIEGAGGLMVPLTDQWTVLDLIVQLGIPTLIVGRGGLGTINHTTLTIAALQHRALPVYGFILSNQHNTPPARVQANADAIHSLTGATYLGALPHIPDCEHVTADTLASAIPASLRQQFTRVEQYRN